MKLYIYIITALVLVILTSCSLNDDVIAPNNEVIIKVEAMGLSVHNVTTRGSDAKTSDEKEIKSLSIFVYDNSGKLVRWIKQSSATEILSIEGKDVDLNTITEGKIYAIANIPINFDENEIATFDDIKEKQYQINKDYISLDIPETGIPMVGYLEGVNMTTGNVYTVELKALMARIDLVLSIKSEHHDSINNDYYPQMKINSITINNIPTVVPFASLSDNATTSSDDVEFVSRVKEINSEIIKDNIGELRYSFYVYENMQGSERTISSIPEKANAQNYKPLIAVPKKDMHLVFNSDYYDVSGNVYDVDYTLYLGANHTNDFNVKRNHQYINTITIKGINKTNQSFNETISFDARVEVNGSATGQDDFYISMINERDLDAHYAVVPMDIYLIDGDGDNTNNPINYVTVSIAPDDDGDTPDWLRLEAPTSFNGTAYNGIRDYFTTDLVTNTLKDTGKSVNPTSSTNNGNFGRVYIYVDENLTTKDYEAKIKVTYVLENGNSITRTVIIRQLGLLEVEYTSGSKTYTIYMERYEEYLEHWDPLDEHASDRVYEALPWQATNKGNTITGISAASTGDDAEVYVNGLDNTQKIYSSYKYSPVKLTDGVPKTSGAAEYCYNKNKITISGSSATISLDESKSAWFLPAIRELENALIKYYTLYSEFQDNFYWSSAPAKKSSGFSSTEQDDRARASRVVIQKEDKYYSNCGKTHAKGVYYVESGSTGGEDNYEACKDNYEKGKNPEPYHDYSGGVFGIGKKDNFGYHGGKALRTQPFRVRAFWKGTIQTTRPYSNEDK